MESFKTDYKGIKLLITKDKEGQQAYFAVEGDKIINVTEKISDICVRTIETKKIIYRNV